MLWIYKLKEILFNEDKYGNIYFKNHLPQAVFVCLFFSKRYVLFNNTFNKMLFTEIL